MSKVTLPKEVGEAIENLRDFGFTDYGIIVESADTTRKGNEIDELRIIRKFTFESEGDGAQIILQALVNGYEVEETPEDKLLAEYEYITRVFLEAELHGYESNEDYFRHRFYYRGLRDGIQDTLEILGIEIEGIGAGHKPFC